MRIYTSESLYSYTALSCVATLLGAVGCTQPLVSLIRPDVRPKATTEGTDSLSLDSTRVKPMYTELLPIDLQAVLNVVTASNIDIRLARYQVQQSAGRYESTVGGAFPMLVPSALFQRIDGRNLNSNGNLFNVGFNTFQPSIAVRWVLNPGSVVYEIIASKKRLEAAEYREEAVHMEALRLAVTQFYELVFAQASIDAAHEAVQEANELVRISEVRARAGIGVPADEMRARARQAEREQDLAIALNALYRASLALSLTLQLEDPTVTLVPKAGDLFPVELVDSTLEIGVLLAHAVQHRPDLSGVRKLIEAAQANRGATWWGGFGPGVELSYEYGGITGNANNIDSAEGIPGNLIVNPLSDTGTFSGNPFENGLVREGIQRGSQRLEGNRNVTFKFGQRTEANAGIAARWSLSAFGDLKAAAAAEQQAVLESERALLSVKTEVIDAAQASHLNRSLMSMAKRQVTAAEEALRLSQANYKAGTMTTIDVLQAQDAVAQARLRRAEAVVRYNQSQVNLLASIGLLDESALASES